MKAQIGRVNSSTGPIKMVAASLLAGSFFINPVFTEELDVCGDQDVDYDHYWYFKIKFILLDLFFFALHGVHPDLAIRLQNPSFHQT